MKLHVVLSTLGTGLFLGLTACRSAETGPEATDAPPAVDTRADTPAVDVVAASPEEHPDEGLVDGGSNEASAVAGAQDPTPAGAEEAPESAFQRLLAEMSVHYFPDEKKLEIAGWVNMQRGLVEVFACAPEGKTHESVVVLDCVPSGLHAGLLALGIEPGTPVEIGTDGTYTPPTGDPVEIRVRWTGDDGQEHVARAEDWIWNQKTQSAMSPSSWIFAGSFMQPVSGRSGEATYAANYVKSLVTTYHDASSILETTHPDGIDDTVYYANENAVPAVGTPVTVVFFPAD